MSARELEVGGLPPLRTRPRRTVDAMWARAQPAHLLVHCDCPGAAPAVERLAAFGGHWTLVARAGLEADWGALAAHVDGLGDHELIVCAHPDCPRAAEVAAGRLAAAAVRAHLGSSDDAERARALAAEQALFTLEAAAADPALGPLLAAGRARARAWVHEPASGDLWAYDPEEEALALVPPLGVARPHVRDAGLPALVARAS